MPEAEIAVHAAARQGQAPTWDSRTDTLLWVDPPSTTVHRFSPSRGVDDTMTTPQPVGAAKPRSRGGLLLHLDDGIAVFEADGDTRTWLVYWQRAGFRAGETVLDAHGQLWATTVRADDTAAQEPAASTRSGSWLARITSEGHATTVLTGMDTTRGVCFDVDGTTLYLVEGAAGRIDQLSVDTASGQVHERRALCEVAGQPGGICADAEGFLWVTIRDSGRIDRYTPDGVRDGSVPLPARYPTDCCFGGNRLTDLYITTAHDPADTGSDGDGSVLVLPDVGNGTRTPVFAG